MGPLSKRAPNRNLEVRFEVIPMHAPERQCQYLPRIATQTNVYRVPACAFVHNSAYENPNYPVLAPRCAWASSTMHRSKRLSGALSFSVLPRPPDKYARCTLFSPARYTHTPGGFLRRDLFWKSCFCTRDGMRNVLSQILIQGSSHT